MRVADGLSLESEGQKVSSDLQDPSQYSGRSQQYCSLDDLGSSSDFKLLQPSHWAFGDCSKYTNYNWYHRHPLIPMIFLDLSMSLFHFLDFHFVVSRDGNVHNSANSLFFFFFFFANYHKAWSSSWVEGIYFFLKISENFVRLIFQDGFWFVRIPSGSMVKSQFLAQFPVNRLIHPVVSSLVLFLR